jgi:hypothetical protein
MSPETIAEIEEAAQRALAVRDACVAKGITSNEIIAATIVALSIDDLRHKLGVELDFIGQHAERAADRIGGE